MRQLLYCGIFLLVSCTVPDVASPAPTPEAIFVHYPAALQPWAEALADCSTDYPQAAIYFQLPAEAIADTHPSKVILQLGELPQITTSGYLAQVGSEQLIIIVNRENSLVRLTSDELRSMYTGQVSRWAEDAGQQVKVWAYPDGDPIRIYFDLALFPSETLTTNAMLAPDPEAMLETVAQDTASLGYLPESFLSISNPALTDKVKIVKLSDALAGKFNLPVIAITQSEPQGTLRNLLVCLQDRPPQ